METTASDIQYASRIVERLVSLPEENWDMDLEGGLVISDLQTSTRQFLDELAIAQDLLVAFPALRVGADLVPISFLSMAAKTEFLVLGFPHSTQWRRDRRWWRSTPWIWDWVTTAAAELGNTTPPDNDYGRLDPSEAREAFYRLSIDFLATRVAAVRNSREGKPANPSFWPRPATLNLAQTTRGHRVTAPGCHFSVSTDSVGLRVFWSGAYYIASNYFGHPTSPATSVLQAGTYVFGVDGGAYGNKTHWDTNGVISLPGNPFIHLCF